MDICICRTLRINHLYLRSRAVDNRVNKENWTVDIMSAVFTLSGHERDEVRKITGFCILPLNIKMFQT